MRKPGHTIGKNSVPVMMASVALVMLFLAQPFLTVMASEGPSPDGTVAPLATGPRAVTYYANHPRILFRDTAWAGGLSVQDLRNRCQSGTVWWAQCQRLLAAGPGVDREMATYAMRYILQGNNADADYVITKMKAVNTAVANATTLADLSLAFDWVYNYTNFLPADKTTVENKIDALAITILNSMSYRHIWAKDMAEIGAVGLAGLALEGHLANADKYLASSIQNGTYEMAALDYSNGTWPEGLWYLDFARLPHFLEFLEGYRTATQPSIDYFNIIKTNQHDWLRKMLYFHIYNYEPYGENARLGDMATGSLKYYFRPNLELMVNKTRDAAGAEYLKVLEANPKCTPTYTVGTTFKFLLWYDPTIPSNGLSSLPKVAWLGPGTFDYVVMRTGWGPSDEVITFRSGDGFANHEHLDSGSFTVTRGVPLVINSGTNATAGTEHRENYYLRTVATDAMNIYMSGEAFQCPAFGGWCSNDGGERIYSYNPSFTTQEDDVKLSTYIASKTGGTHFETGNIIDLNVNSDYVYVQGDYTQAYNSPYYKVTSKAKVNLVTREMVLLGPEWLVIKDRAVTALGSYKTRFPLHMLSEPTISGNISSWDEGGAAMYDGDTVTIDQNNTHLFSKTLFPTNHLIINRTGGGREYWADSNDRTYGATTDWMGGDGRVDVQDMDVKTDHEFLNVMNIQAAGGSSTMPPVVKVNEVEVMGAYFNNSMVLFSSGQNNYRFASVNITQTGPTKVHAFDIAPNAHYQIMNLNRKTNKIDYLSADSGPNATMDFNVNLTGDNQIIIGWSMTGDLVIDSLTYTPAKPNLGDNITVKATIKNKSTYSFTACNWFLDFYNGNPDSGGVKLGNGTVDLWPLSTKILSLNITLPWKTKSQQVFARLRPNLVCPFVDSDGTDNTQNAYIYINAQPVPVIVAPDKAWVNTVVQFDGSQSYDLEGALQSKKWNWGDGSPVEGGTIPTHKFWYPGTFNVTLTIVDTNGVSNSTVHKILIRNLIRTPVPYFDLHLSPYVEVGNITTAYIFNSTSLDLDHIIQWYLWDFGDGTNSSGTNVTHYYKTNGYYNISLTIGWNDTETATAWWHWLHVLNLGPHAAAEVNGTTEFTTFKNELLFFNGSATEDPDDDPVQAHTYRWFFDPDNTMDHQDGVTVTHRYHKSGTYLVRLMVQEVVDNILYSDNATVKVNIQNRPPHANISITNKTLEWGELLYVDGWRSSDPDNDTLIYLWDFGDNSTPAHGMIGKHYYTEAGLYKVTLTVTDPDKGTDKVMITVAQKPEPTPYKPPPKKDDTAKRRMYMIAAGVGIGVAVALIAAVLLMRKKKAKEKEAQQRAAQEKAAQEAAQQAAAQSASEQAVQQYYPVDQANPQEPQDQFVEKKVPETMDDGQGANYK